jgi:hypothetical protein
MALELGHAHFIGNDFVQNVQREDDGKYLIQFSRGNVDTGLNLTSNYQVSGERLRLGNMARRYLQTAVNQC